MTPPDPGPPQSAVQYRPYPEPPVFSLPGDLALRGLEDKGGKERKSVPSLGDTGGTPRPGHMLHLPSPSLLSPELSLYPTHVIVRGPLSLCDKKHMARTVRTIP